MKETDSFVVPIGKAKKQARVKKKLREMQAKHVAEQTAERLRKGTPAEKKRNLERMTGVWAELLLESLL